MFKESLPFYVDGVAVGTNVIIADVCGQATRANKDLFMEFAFEYSHIPKLLDKLLCGIGITVNYFFHFRIPGGLTEIKTGH